MARKLQNDLKIFTFYIIFIGGKKDVFTYTGVPRSTAQQFCVDVSKTGLARPQTECSAQSQTCLFEESSITFAPVLQIVHHKLFLSVKATQNKSNYQQTKLDCSGKLIRVDPKE